MDFIYFAAMVHSLRQTGTRCDIIGIVDSHVHRFLPKYRRLVQEYNILFYRVQLQSTAYISPLFYKVFAWDLIQWPRVVFVEPESIVRNNIDHMFQMTEGTGSCPFGRRHVDWNDGVFVLVPRNVDHLLLLDVVTKKMSQATAAWTKVGNVAMQRCTTCGREAPAVDVTLINTTSHLLKWFFEVVKQKQVCSLDALMYNCLVQFMRCDQRKPALILHYGGMLRPLQRWEKSNATYPVTPPQMKMVEDFTVADSHAAETLFPRLRRKLGRDPKRVEEHMRKWYKVYYNIYPLLLN
uniref:Uncharacterized protein n=1 Tax=Eutreptiella gymnastica TaxID=73025 RepID=A0A6U8P8G1_9EUGL|mmetsp:Transcript_94431/g.163193  ORF Transcript_94431/g.163193 Transcript_94431/m.163193 type:complete len:294 (+) Transcript_94431:798-1679(+)